MTKEQQTYTIKRSIVGDMEQGVLPLFIFPKEMIGKTVQVTIEVVKTKGA